MNIKVIVASHKFYMMPRDEMYVPVHVGAQGKKVIRSYFKRDDEGMNISDKNSSYCELTGLYYAWKNMEYDYLGLAHYRRHFSNAPFILRALVPRINIHGSEMECNSNPHLAHVLKLCLSQKKAEKIFNSGVEIIVPTKRRYVIESLYSHYAHTLEAEHLDIAKEIIKEDYKEYLPYLERVYERTWGYMFNMFIMRNDLVEEYCTWIFDILSRLESLISTDDLSSFEARYIGRVSEILFNVWLLKKQEEDEVKIKEVPLLSTEPINWWIKGRAFLQAKFGGKKYEKSF